MSTLVLVPSPLRATRASRRLCDAEGGILFGPRVVTPAQLAPGLLAAAGDPRALLPPLAERLLAIEAARECGFGTRLDPSGGVARSVAAALSELREAEVPAAAVESAARATPGRAGERLAVCARMLRSYEARLEQVGAVDRAAALAAAAAALQRGRLSEEVRKLDLLVIDGFASMSAAEWRLVEALTARARRTHAWLPFFPERPDLSSPEPLLRRLEGLHDGSLHGHVDLKLERIEGERAAGISSALMSVAGGPGAAGGGAAALEVEAEAGAGEEGEAAVASALAARWIDRGLAPDDVVVFAPSLASSATLARAFAERGVPLARGGGDPLAENPAVRAVSRALSAAAAGHLDRSAAEDLLASTYVTGALPPARFRDLLDRAGALDGRGDPEDALRRRAAALAGSVRERELLLRGAEALADLGRRIAPLRAAGLPREHAARLRAFVAAGVRRRAVHAEPGLARRDLAALKRLDECADAVVAALAMTGRGAAEISAPEWQTLLDAAIGGAAVPVDDPAGGAVELWPVSDAPGLSARAALLTGCVRGAFPAPSERNGLLRDGERAAVNAAVGRAALRPSGAERAAALHEAFCALAAGRESVALTWAAPTDGRGGPPAPLVSEVLAAAGRRLEPAPRPPPRLAAAACEREALEAAARQASAGDAAAVRSALAEVSPGLAARFDAAASRAGVERERLAAAATRAASDHAGAIAPGPLLESALPDEWSPSQLETHARCPFRFFLETPCRLAAPDEAQLEASPRDEGKLLHVILERFVGGRLRRGAPPLADDEAARAELRAVAGEVFGQLEPSGKLGDPALWSAQRELLTRRLERVLASEAAVEAEDGMQPRVLEHAFGGDSAAPPLVVSDGEREVRLCGRVDRIDASTDRLRVLDWKSGRASSGAWRDKVDADAFGVTSFQLPTYLMAARRALPGRARLEAGYVFLRSASRSGTFAADADDPVLSTDAADRARLRDGGGRAFADAVIDVVSRVRAGRFPIAPRDCAGCRFGAVCRAEGSEEDDP